jgi:aspartyl-tRNA(Asn)/glutamyl-tRNA(Gln) amidotransferase subunit B
VSGAFEAVIGLEVHVQLKTRTKLFCGDIVEFGAAPNTHVCPVCLGLPGALPVTNGEAMRLAVAAALGLDCEVHETSVFARKNYFYPDLPKGYQITQFEPPLATGGRIEIDGDDGAPFVVRIRRIHVEEDAGKSLHDRFTDATAVDLNRAGVPLVEIVTEPDLRSPGDARAFLNRLKQTLQYLDVSDCDMEKGSLRVDANVSVRPRAETRLGTKTELKNMNSFSNVERALVYEIDRQVEQRSRGQAIEQQTLLWDESRSMARPMRSKEESHDYRYFPDPDLPPVVLEHGFVGAIRETLPERPAQREKRIVSEFGIPAYDASVLCADRGVADYFERVAVAAGDGKAASNWVMTDVLAWCRQESADIHAFPITAERLADLIRLTMDGTLSSNLARSTFQEMTVSGRAASEIVREKGWVQVRDDDQLERWVHVVLAQHPAEIQRYRDGDTKLLGFFMGRVMQASEGKADPRRVSAMLRERLS